MKIKVIFRQIIYWVVILFFCWVIYNNAGDYSTLLSTLKNANFVYLAWAILLSIGNLAVISSIFRINFSIFQQDIHLGLLLPETIALSFLNISNPLGSAGATAVIIKRLVKKGYGYLKSIFTFLSSQLSINTSFLIVLAITTMYFKQSDSLTEYENIAGTVLIFLNLVYFLLILGVLVLPKFSKSISRFFSNIANYLAKKLFRRSVVNQDKLDSSIDEIQNVSEKFDQSLLKFLKSVLLSSVFHLINILVLYLSFYSFGTILNIQTLLGLYSIIFLFTIISPTPQGIGVAEGLGQIGAISLGVLPEFALVGILTFRAITVWLPAFLGFLFFRKLNRADSN